MGATGSWSLRFRDEFEGTSVNWSRWSDASSAEADGGHGNPGNEQMEWNEGKNCTLAGGVLNMRARRERFVSPSGHSYGWTSCLLSSSPSYAFRYGYIEERAQLPALKGFRPAFWTWQASGNNTWTETDAYEYYSDNHTRLYLAQHSPPGGGCRLTGLRFDPAVGFHVYGADIEPTGTTFYIDGRRVCQTRATSTGLTNIVDTNFVDSVIPPHPASQVGLKQVDYIRAWQHASARSGK
jgi:beta-glucanase (GH16 family)